MSAPHSGSSGGSPAPGFYPDPSIPGYIRYWNGSSWVPGTSRPEPEEGEEMPAPPSAAVASRAVAPPTREEPAPAEETGPVFLDEEAASTTGTGSLPGSDSGPGFGSGPEAQVPAARSGEPQLPEVRPRGEVAPAGPIDWDDPSRLHGRNPEPASAWQADASQQTGFAGQSEERVSWGRDESGGQGRQGWAASEGSQAAADPRGGWGRPAEEEQAPGRMDAGAAAAAGSAELPGAGGAPGAQPREGTFQMRAVSPDALREAAQQARAAGGAAPGAQQPDHTVGLRRSDVAPGQPGGQTPASPGAQPSGAAPSVPGQAGPAQPQVPAQPQAPAQQPQAPAQQPQAPVQQPPAQQPPAQQAPAPGAAQPSWAQQVHDLAGGGAPSQDAPGGPGPDAVMPWRPPPGNDPFSQAAQEARPAALGKRLGARLVDGLLTGAVAAAVAFPFAGKAVDHVQAKIDAVRAAGETKTVWLIDGTTGGYLAVVLGALLLFGLLYEVLPTGRWGRTLGKKLFGLRVLTMEQQDKPGFGSALLRWLTYGVLSALAVGVLNVLWCVFDRPWRQCWHDKLAGTFVSRDSGEIRL